MFIALMVMIVSWICYTYTNTHTHTHIYMVALSVESLPAMQETRVQSLGKEDPLEKGMATHSSIFAWRIPWTEELGRLQSMGSHRLRHNWVTNTLTFTFHSWRREEGSFELESWYIFSLIFWWRRKWEPTLVFLSGEFHGQKSLVGYSL